MGRCVPCVASESSHLLLKVIADGRPADPSPEEWKARASLTALPGRLAAPAAKSEGADSELEPTLCYACLTTLNGRKEAEMPSFVEQGLRARSGRVGEDEMRAQIADFLIDEGEA